MRSTTTIRKGRARLGVVPRSFGQKAASFPGGPSQGLVDPLLPAWTAFLKELENILVDTQGDKLLHTGQLRPRRDGLHGLLGH